MSPHDTPSSAPTAGRWPDNQTSSEELTTPREGAAAAPLMLPVPPQRVGLYELAERIGWGGLGDVYRARHVETGEEVALKILRECGDGGAGEGRSFLREVEAAQRLSHPGILPIREGGRHQGRPYYVMALVPGGTLEGRLRGGPVEPAWAAALLARVARAVEHAHARGVLHRDLKPANILLGQGDAPLVADFGLARFADHTSCHTRTGQVVGSLPYMAPEQASGHGHRSAAATDVWALGVILYEMLTGRRPFRGDDSMALLHRILHEAPLAPRRLRAGVPGDLEGLCLRCLEKAPQDRPASAAALADGLEAWLRGESPRTPMDVRSSVRRALRRAGPGRVGLLSLLGLTVAATLVCVLPGESRDDAKPRLARADPLRALARAKPGQKIPLIVNGVPIAGKFIVGGGWSHGRFKATPAWINTPNLCLFEILPPDPNRGDYRLWVTMKQLRGPAPTGVGLYAGRYGFRGDAAADHVFAHAWYCEPSLMNLAGLPAGLAADMPHLRLDVRFASETDQDVMKDQAGGSLASASLARPGDRPQGPPQGPPNRTFCLEVRKAGLGLRLPGGKTVALPAHAFEAFSKPTLEGGRPRLKGRVAMPSPTGGAGIIVEGGAVEIDELLFEPLTPDR